ncbi:MAG: HD domain-containing protein [Euryarchaeota archaeon]|nr:HD domain-containing protein [Euryarchaeota archaeon]
MRVRGLVSEYREVLEIGVSPDKGGAFSPVAQTEFRIEDFVGSSSKDIAQMMTALASFIGQVGDPMLKSLLSSFFSDERFVERFKTAPASISIHANWIGGLLEHTLNVLQMCDLFSRIYPRMDRDLLLAGAVLHDIGKVEEYRTTTSIDETVDGMLRGHLTIGAEMVAKACDSIPGFPENLKLKLAHMVLSHHCRPEFGSPKAPMFPEAMAVYLADDADSRIEQYVRAKEEAQTEDIFAYSKRLGSIYLG